MSKIDYQALREAAEKATWGDWDSYKPHRGARGYEVRLSSQAIAQHVLKNNAEFIAAFNPKVALALLDEREKNQQYIKRRDQENEMMVDAMHAAIALTSVGIDLDDYDECVLRLHEWGALPDYCIALYVDFVHGIVSKNKLLDFGYINGAPVWTLRDELEAANKRIAELEAEPVSQAYNLAELIEGMEVSIDVSTCDADLGNRYFGTVTEALELDTAKNGYILLVQDAEPNFDVNGNYPVTPDGWISCSERMPDTKTAVLVAKEFDRKGDWRMKWATYIPGHPDANDGWIIPGASWKPSHWMPLPEPPQEVK